jgi:urea transport system ATP-binding protein
MARQEMVLDIEDLTVSFDGFKAIDSLNLYVDKGELRVIIGPNGAGKTTLLDLICGKTRSSAGRIRFMGIEVTRLPEHEIVREGIGRKFQTPSIYENLSVWQNLEVSFPRGRSVFGALAFKCDDEVSERVRSVASEINLGDQLQTEAGLLSHGQKQWLEIGMLLMQDPKLLLLDEPVAGMTDEETDRTAELFLTLKGKHSLLVVEHDMNFIRSISDIVTVLCDGSVLAQGTLDKVQADERVIEVYLGR